MTRRLFFVTLMIVGVIAAAEAIGAAFLRFGFDGEERRRVRVALGLDPDDFNSALRYRAHPYVNFVSNPEFSLPDGSRPHHPIGIRATDLVPGGKPAGSLRIVALGGSTTYGMYFWNAGDVWPSLTARFLRVAFPETPIETINAGVPNHSTYEMIGMAAMWVPEFAPDLVLVHTGLNDAFSTGYPDEGGPDNTAFRFAWTHRPIPAPARTLMRHSLLLRALGSGWLSRGAHAVGGMTDAMQYPPPSPAEVRRNAERATGKYFRRNLHSVIALIRRAGAEPVLIEMPLNPTMERGRGEYYDGVSAAVVRNNGIMAEVARDEAISIVPLYDRMRDPDLYKDAAHLDQQGMLLKARLVAEGIVPVIARILED